MKVYIAALINAEGDSEFLGVYTTEDLAIGRVEREIESLQDNSEDYGVIPVVVESMLDDVDLYT